MEIHSSARYRRGKVTISSYTASNIDIRWLRCDYYLLAFLYQRLSQGCGGGGSGGYIPQILRIPVREGEGALQDEDTYEQLGENDSILTRVPKVQEAVVLKCQQEERNHPHS